MTHDALDPYGLDSDFRLSRTFLDLGNTELNPFVELRTGHHDDLDRYSYLQHLNQLFISEDTSEILKEIHASWNLLRSATDEPASKFFKEVNFLITALRLSRLGSEEFLRNPR